MNKREINIMHAVETAWPSMTEFNKGYILGMLETEAKRKKEEDGGQERDREDAEG